MKRLIILKTLASRVLMSMAFRLSLVVLLSTIVCYFHLINILAKRTQDDLSKYIWDRGEFEQITFSGAEKNHKVLVDEFKFRLQKISKEQVLKEFAYLTQKFPDGHIRNNKSHFEGRRDAGIYIQKDAIVTYELKKKIVVGYHVVKDFGPALHSQFQNTYFTFPEKAMVIYWPEEADWVYNIKADYKLQGEEWFVESNTKFREEDKTFWTGTFFDPVSELWAVTSGTPFCVGNEHYASVHHDLFLGQIFDRTINNALSGTVNYLIREDGRFIAHPTLQKEIEKKNGLLFINEVSDQSLKDEFRAIKRKKVKDGVIDLDENADVLLGVAYIEGPGWYLVTPYPKPLLRSAASSALSFVVVLGVLSLIFELIIVGLVLKDLITEPLDKLVNATKNVAHGNFDVELDTRRHDELGEFARSFVMMQNTLLARDKALEEHNKNLETIIKQKTQELEQERLLNIHASKMAALGEMAGGVAHEINTPLASILLRANQIQDMCESKEADFNLMNECANGIEKTVQRVAKIIQGLRTFSRDGSKNPFEKIMVKTLINDTLELAREKFKSEGIDIQVDVLPEDLEIYCRSVQMSQVLLNLLNNSYDAISQIPDKWIRIQVVVTKDLHQVELSVTDCGKGVSSEIAEKIMQPFFTTKVIGKGTGLGLSISRGIIKDHNGDLYLDTKHVNTRFVIVLPYGEQVHSKAI